MAEQQRQTRRTVFGTLILIALIASALLVFFMESLLGAFERNYTIHLVLPGATGLAAESPIWVSGRHVGRITAVGLLPSGGDSLARVVVDVELPVSVQPHVRTDSEVRVTSIGPISEKVIDIGAGSTAAPVLPPGDTLRQTPGPTPAQLTARAAEIRVNLNAVVADFQQHMPAIHARLRQTEQAFASLESVMNEAQRVQLNLSENPGYALLQSPAFAASLEGTRSHAAELPVMIGRLRGSTGTGPAAEVQAALARLQLRSDSLRTQLTAALAALDNPNGTLSRMQQDTAITRAINAARMELDSLIADARRNPLRFVF